MLENHFFKGMKYEKKKKVLRVEERSGETSWKLALDYAEMERRQTEPCALAAGRHGGQDLHVQEHIFTSKLDDRIKETWKLSVQLMNFSIQHSQECRLAGNAFLIH